MTNYKPIQPSSITGKVLMFLARQDGKWSTWGSSFYVPTVQSVFPVGTKEKVQFRFMRRLQSAGLVGGCDCYGDYTPTLEGLQFLANECLYGEKELERWKKEGYSFGY